MSDSMFSTAFDVLIKISESYQPQIPSVWARCGPNVGVARTRRAGQPGPGTGAVETCTGAGRLPRWRVKCVDRAP